MTYGRYLTCIFYFFYFLQNKTHFKPFGSLCLFKYSFNLTLLIYIVVLEISIFIQSMYVCVNCVKFCYNSVYTYKIIA